MPQSLRADARTPNDVPLIVTAMIGLFTLVPLFLKGQWQIAGLGTMLLLVGVGWVALATRAYPIPRSVGWITVGSFLGLGYLAYNAWHVSGVQLESAPAWWWWVVGVSMMTMAAIWSHSKTFPRLLGMSIIGASALGAAMAAFVYMTAPHGRAGGLFFNPNALGPFLLWGILLLIPFVFHRPRRWWVMLGWALCLAMFALSVSVTSIAAALIPATVAVWFLRPRPLTRRWWATLVAVLLTATAGWFAVKPIVTSTFLPAQGASFSFFQRLEFNRTAWAMAANRPWSGWGIGSYQTILPRFTHQSQEQPRYAHNTYVQLLAEAGWPMTAVWVFFVIYAGWSGWKRWRSEGDEATRRWIFALWLGWVALTIASGLDFGWYFPAVAVPWWLITGIFMSRPATVVRPRAVFRLVYLGLAAAIVLFGARMVVADIRLLQAHQAGADQRSEEYVTNLSTSVAMFPIRNGLLEYVDVLLNIDTNESRRIATNILSDFLKQNPDDYAMTAAYARLAQQSGDTTSALLAYRSAYTLDPVFHPRIVLEFVNLLRQQGEEDQAKQIVREVIDRLGPNPINPIDPASLQALRALAE